MQIIFLDIDGVMNSYDTKPEGEKSFGIHPIMVDRFNAILKATGAYWVLSSTWRKSDTWYETMREAGLCMDRCLGRTPSMPLRGGAEMMERGKECEAWLAANPTPHCDSPTSCPPFTRAMCMGHKVERYIVIDDDSDFLPHQKRFATSLFSGGLTKEIAHEIVAYLSTPIV